MGAISCHFEKLEIPLRASRRSEMAIYILSFGHQKLIVHVMFTAPKESMRGIMCKPFRHI